VELLLGITFKQWLQLFFQNKIYLTPSSWGKFLKLFILSIRNSFFASKEEKQFAQQYTQTEIHQPPVFILGHWRSGTTLLHSLLSLDDQFSFPNLFEIYNPHTFLTLAPMLEQRLARLKAQKRPMDNMKTQFSDPGEDEFAISILGLNSPVLAWSFPKNETYYDRFLALQTLPDKEIERWKETFLLFLKKLTLKYKKPLLLKSPQHTARVKYLLQLFPDAKFIHIYRNPYRVFQSTLNLYKNTVANLSLQKRDINRDIQGIIRRYQEMFETYFQDKALIPSENLIEMSFEELEQDFREAVHKIFKYFDWNQWDSYQPRLEKYLSEQSTYKKNDYAPIPQEWKKKINEQWGEYFEYFGYSIEN